MPQELHVVRCYSCNMFQVDIVKKSKKWQCKLCNSKQSLQQVFFKGSGKDCRIHVQNLNGMKQYESQTNTCFETSSNVYCSTSQDNDYSEQCSSSKSQVIENKWAKYLDISEDDQFDTFADSSTCEDIDKSIVSHNSEKNDNSMYLHNDDDNIQYDFSVNDYVDTSLHDEDDVEQSIIYDNDKECDNTENEIFDNKDSNDIHSENRIKSQDSLNIFDDNEDFDVAIDF